MIRTIWLCLILGFSHAHAQEAEAAMLEEQIRDRSASGEEAGDPVDEGLSWDRGFSLRRKLPLNYIDPASLGELMGLTSLQVEAFETYRRRLGPFVDPLELQAVPGWDEATVRRVLPWVHVDDAPTLPVILRTRSRSGTHAILLRTGVSTTDITGAASAPGDGRSHVGGPSHVLFRYGYRYGGLMQWGLTVEKDAGERIPGKAGLPVADFLSGQLALRDWKGFRVMVIGDYQANLGQGLTHWQGMAFRKTSDAMMILRQGPSLRPYSGTDENRFHRGGAFEWARGGWSVTAFLSGRRLDANRVVDTIGGGGAFVSSLLTSGLHRTDGERQDRHVLSMRAVGGRISYRALGAVFGLNAVAGRFGMPIRKDPLPYNLYAFSGTDWSNLSLDFGLPVRNAYLFGEFAMDGRGGLACVQGFVASLHPRLDLAWLSRAIQPRYRSLHANAFTEQSEPNNETGNYAGVCLRLPGGWKVDAWLDTYRFPWLRYRVDRPSSGVGYLVNLAWTPDRKTEWVFRWQREARGANASDGRDGWQMQDAMHSVLPVSRSGFRWQATFRPGPEWMVRTRVEGSRALADGVVEDGFLCHFDLQCRPVRTSWRVMGRMTFFETEGYASRIYGFENDVPFRSAMSVYHGKGLRGYLITGWRSHGTWSISAKMGFLIRGDVGLSDSYDVRLQAILTLGGRGGVGED
jgi:hypothetical protein